MSCRGNPSTPRSGSNPTASPTAATPQCPPTACPAMEIEINDTPAVNDDLVQLKCEHPAHRTTVNCRIRATAACPTSSTVVLTNPNGRLRFPNAGDTTTTLTVPGDGSWVPFQISGETGSNAIGDAVIEAHCNTATGALKASKGVTVFWFDQAQINVTPESNYSMVGDRYTASAGVAVRYSAQARIRPAGVDCASPQVTNLRIGILQNLIPPYTKTKIWDTPSILWNPGVVAGTSVTVANSRSFIISVPTVTNDVTSAAAAPLYVQSATSLKPPIGCAGGAAATSNDTPSTPFPPRFTLPATTAAGVVVGTTRWSNRVKVVLNKNFKTWAVLFDTTTNHLCALRERGWSLHADSSAAAAQIATADANDTAPTVDPVTAPPFGNDRTNDPANQTNAPVGAATTTFTQP
jgi:hypothetical protein